MKLRSSVSLLMFSLPLFAPLSLGLMSQLPAVAQVSVPVTPPAGADTAKAEIPASPTAFAAFTTQAAQKLKLHQAQVALDDATLALAIASKIMENGEQPTAEFNKTLALAYRTRAAAQIEIVPRESAMKDFMAALKLEPQDVDTLAALAIAKSESGYFGGEKDVAAALAINPRSPAALTARGALLMKKGTHFQADDATRAATLDYDAAIASDPKYAPAYFYRSKVRSLVEDKEGSLADLDKAIELDPNFIKYYEERIYRESKDPVAVLADYGHIIALAPNNAERYLDRTRFLARQPKPDDQLLASDYEKAITLTLADIKADTGVNPYRLASFRSTLGTALTGRGELRLRRNELDTALLDFDMALKIYAKDQSATAGRARILIGKGQAQNAVAEIYGVMPKAREIAIPGAIKKGLAARGAAFLALKQWQEALVDLNAAIKDDSLIALGTEHISQDAELYFNRALAYNGLHQSDKALDNFNVAAKLNPGYITQIKIMPYGNKLVPRIPNKDDIVDTSNSAVAHKLLGNEWRTAKDADKALAEFNKAIEVDANYADAYNNRAAIYRVTNKPELALADFDKAVELAPTRAMFIYNRGNFHRTEGRMAQSIADLQKAVLLDPKDDLIMEALGSSQQAAGQFAAAEVSYRTELKASTTDATKRIAQIHIIVVRACQNIRPTDVEAALILGGDKEELKSIQLLCAEQLKSTPDIAALVALNQMIQRKQDMG
ncbi:hypothetical protein IAD21_03466 [Abditibacteriota bacterium]|nr:hypothetical protein IAD21_03466 [Abditibacteriota bacterium]